MSRRGNEHAPLPGNLFPPVSEGTLDLLEFMLRDSSAFIESIKADLEQKNPDLCAAGKKLGLDLIDRRVATSVAFFVTWWMLDKQLKRPPSFTELPLVFSDTIQEVIDNWDQGRKYHKDIGETILLYGHDVHRFMLEGIRKTLAVVYGESSNRENQNAGETGMLFMYALLARQEEKNRQDKRKD